MADIRDRIEKWFEGVAKIIYENKYKTLLIIIVAIVALFSQLPKITIDTSTEGFLHEEDQKLIDYNNFRDQFGRDELVIVAVKTRDVFDLKFLEIIRQAMKNESSAISFLVRRTSLGDADEIIKVLSLFDGEIAQTTFSSESEAYLNQITVFN